MERHHEQQYTESLVLQQYSFTGFHAPYTAAYSNTVTNPVGISNFEKSSAQLHISPNPASTCVTLNYSGLGLSLTEITNILGQKIYAKSFIAPFTEKIDLLEIPNGAYLVTVSENGQRSEKKLIVVH